MKPVKRDSPVMAQRRQRAVEMFLAEGFSASKAVRLAAMYIAVLKKMANAKAKEKAEADSKIALPSTPLWVPNRTLKPHERLAQRIKEFGRMSSEQAHQKAAALARAADAGG